MTQSRLAQVDPDVFNAIQREEKRQEEGLELIASENYCSRAVMEAQGSCLTNKYAEGYPGKRYYNGCEFVDQVETLAIERLKKIFGAAYANVQPHSGSGANMAVYMATLQPGDAFLGMDLSQGGHLTHGSPVNFSGKLYRALHYGLDPKTEMIDYDALAEIARKEKPKMIIGGASAYPRFIDFARMAQIAHDVGAVFFVDMAHIAGLVAADVHPSPMPHAHVVSSTTHKTLRGPRGGVILTNHEDWAKKFNSLIFPGIQGGPLEHVIAGKAVAFHEALQPAFKTYQQQVVKNAKVMAEVLMSEDVQLVSGGTDNHLVLVKTDSVGMSGKEASELLEKVDITCNKNMVPADTRSPFVTSGIRLGTPAVTTRGFKEEEIRRMTKLLVRALKHPNDGAVLERVKADVRELCHAFPLYP